METRNEETPLKIRSIRAAVSAGFRLYMGNFRRIFRATWLAALLCALVSAVYFQTAHAVMAQLLQTFGPSALPLASDITMNYLVQSGLTLLNALVSVFFMSYAFSMLASHRADGAIPYPTRWWSLPDSHALMRTLASTAVWFLTYMVVGCMVMLGVHRHSFTLIGFILVAALVFVALMLPLVYPHMRYLTTRDTKLFSLLRTGYGQGLRQWGYIFAILFVVLLIMMLILTATMLPAIILVTASMKSQAGALIGDPLGMPSYMGWLSFLVFILSGFVQAYVVLAIHFPVYYMAGSIEQQDIQKNETAANTLH